MFSGLNPYYSFAINFVAHQAVGQDQAHVVDFREGDLAFIFFAKNITMLTVLLSDALHTF